MITFCHMNQLTPFSKSRHFQFIKFILIEQFFFHGLLKNKHSLIYNQNDCFAFSFVTLIKADIQVLRFLKSVSISHDTNLTLISDLEQDK